MGVHQKQKQEASHCYYEHCHENTDRRLCQENWVYQRLNLNTYIYIYVVSTEMCELLKMFAMHKYHKKIREFWG
jgi:hypothetical protein